jgi:glycosyltransferase involved in cell wall biosynthesis
MTTDRLVLTPHKGGQEYSSSVSQIAISIIVPVFNCQIYLEKCLDSLINQTLQNIEVLCINDGSTDGSLEILQNYQSKDNRIKVFTQSNHGAASARNVGLKNAVGKYIMFCDGDDWYELGACFECFDAIEKEKVDWVFFGVNVIDNAHRKNIDIVERQITFNPRASGLLSKKEIIKFILSSVAVNKLLKRDLLNKFNMSFPNIICGEETIFFTFYLMAANKGYSINKKFYNYFMHRGSLTDYDDANWYEQYFKRIIQMITYSFKFGLKNKMLSQLIYVYLWIFRYVLGRVKCKFESHNKKEI